MKKAVLVTGGAGYIGSCTCQLLAENGFLPITYDNLSTGHAYSVKWGPLIEGDIADTKKLQEVISSYSIDVVVHFASSALVSESVKEPALYYHNNVLGTLSLLEAMRKTDTHNIIFSSSCAIYGIPKKVPILEDEMQNPINPYGKTKLMIEQILSDYSKSYQLNYVSLRYFNAAGADISNLLGENHTEETHLIPLAIESALLEKELHIYGDDFPTKDGSAIRDYIHIKDLAKAHLLALFHLESDSTSISCNLGTGIGSSVFEIVSAIETHLNKKIKVTLSPKRDGDPPILFADNTKAYQLLKWKPTFSDLTTIISSACQWHAIHLPKVCII